MRNAFLTGRLRPIAPVSVVRNGYRAGCNYITRENYEYLLASAERYASLLGRELGHSPGGGCSEVKSEQPLTPGEGIANLYRELSALVGDDVNLNIETEDNRLVFVLWNAYRWEGYNLYWLPVKFVEKLRTPLRRLAISFLHRVHRIGRLDTTNHCDDIGMIVEWYEDADDQPEAERAELLELMHSYKEGHIRKLMGRIEKRDYHPDLPAALAEFVPENDYERELVVLMTEGLEVFDENKPTIFHFEYDPLLDEENDDHEPVMIDRTIRLIYENDHIMESVREYLSDQAGNYGEVVPCATLTLRPDGDTLFGMDDYSVVFFRYMEKLLNFLHAH